MQNAKILPVIGLAMTLAALVGNYALPHVSIPSIKKVPVETFPRALGEWQAGADQAVDPEVQQKLSTATIITRDYRRPDGQALELTLISGSQRADFHNPNECFPGHGWTLSEHQERSIGGQKFNTMMGEMDAARIKVYYCWMGALDVERPRSAGEQTLYALRDTIFSGIMDRADGMSVFVRVIVPDDEKGRQAAVSFLEQLLPPVRALLKQYIS
jgi:EpsI family protein